MTNKGVGLTFRGRFLLGVGITMALAAVLVGIQELYPLAVAAVALVIACRIWVSRQAWDLHVFRQVHPVRVAAGHEARVELIVRNVDPRRSPPVLAADPFDGGRRWARFTIAPLHAGQTRRASYRLPTTRRGIFRLGPLEMEVADPFGLARSTVTNTPDTSLTVHPRVEQVSTRSLSAHNDQDIRFPLPVIGRGGNEFYTLREYEPGDDLRHVHWASTARLGDLVIRQPENLWKGRLTVAIDVRSASHDPDSLEAALSAAASLTLSALGTGLQVRMVTTSGIDTGHGGTGSHANAILDVLAAADVRGGGSLADDLRGFRCDGPVVVVTTERCSDDDLASAFRVGGRTTATVVAFDVRRPEGAAAPPAAYPPLAGGLYVRVPVGGSFAAAWNGTLC